MGRRRKKKGLLSFLKRGGGHSYGGGNLREHFNLSSETKKGIFIILLFVLGVLSLLGLFDLSGEFGRMILKILSLLLGSLKWLFPVLTILFAYFLLREGKYNVRFINYFGAILLVFGLTALWHLQFGAENSVTAAKEGLGGGFIGVAIILPLLKFMSFWGAFVIALALFFIGLLLTFETSIYGLMWPVKLLKFIFVKFKEIYIALRERTAREPHEDEGDDNYEEDEEDPSSIDVTGGQEDEESEDGDDAPQFKKTAINAGDREDEEMSVIAKPKKFGKKIELPLDLLTSKSGKPTSGDIKSIQLTIKKTLANFGINVEMGEVHVGPTVTQYTFRPADGVKLSRITNLNSDLALALAAHPIRIEAPIPGKSLVGVEIPNQMAAKVTMMDLLSSKEFKTRDSNLNIALGKDVSGKSCFSRLDKMPHLLIAGATGSGKSVCINSVIVSLLYQNSPDDLKFILVDPKRVELPFYNGIPYLLTPVITDVKKTINALKWTIVEMEKRFELLSKKGKRNIESYNKDATDRLPYIVFIIDELADLMSTAGSDVEAGIVRLAQMSRAVGIHLILATQRPSVEVITGLIKANIPARISFSVASLIDSRTILDSSGAEKLVGRGDMLHLGPDISKPKRIQGVFLSEKETKNIVNYIKKQGEAEYIEDIVEKQQPGILGSGGGSSFDDDGDALLGDAKDVIVEAGKASASLLQRRLKIGYARAARILDLLEEQGVIGPADGAKPREVFLDQLDGYQDPLEFAAREHGLEGELEPQTVLKGDDEEVDEEVIEDDETEEEVEEVEPEVEEELEEDDDLDNEEIDIEEDKKSDTKKKFQEDEWT